MAYSISKTIFLYNSYGNVNTNGANRNNTKIYYYDNSQDGCWNHSEMMRYERIYNGDNGLPAAQIETPLKENAGWMRGLFQ